MCFAETTHENVSVPTPWVAKHLDSLVPMAAREFMVVFRAADFQCTSRTRQPVIRTLALLGHAHSAVRNQAGKNQARQGHGGAFYDTLALLCAPNAICFSRRFILPRDSKQEAGVA